MPIVNSTASRGLLLLALVLTFGPGKVEAQKRAIKKPVQGRTSNRVNAAPRADVTLALGVLPFRNAQNDSEIATLGDGIADSLSNALKGVARFSITDMDLVAKAAAHLSRTLATDQDALEIGQFLGVQMVIVGSYQRFGGQMRIDARILSVDLNRALPDSVISITKPYPDGYSTLLNELAIQATNKLRARLTAEESQRVSQSLQNTPSSQRAEQLYDRGLQSMRKGTEEELSRAVEFFSQALEQDPNFAFAYAAKSEAETQLFEFQTARGNSNSNTARSAVDDANKSIASAPNSGRGHKALARAQRALGNYGSAEASARRALSFWPSDADAYLELARALGRGRLTESPELKRAFELQRGLWLILDELPRVTIFNQSPYALSVLFVSLGGGKPITVHSEPHSSRAVALLPGSFNVIAQSRVGKDEKQYDFLAGQNYDVIFKASDVEPLPPPAEDSTFVFENTGQITVTFRFSGPKNGTLSVAPGQSTSVDVPSGEYSVTCQAYGLSKTKTYSVQAGTSEHALCAFVRRRL